MDFTPPMWMRIVCNIARGFLAVLSLAVALVVGAAVIVPLAIFVPPLVAILGGLLVVMVFAATESMAGSWHASRMRRRGGPAPARRTSPAAATVREPLHGVRGGR